MTTIYSLYFFLVDCPCIHQLISILNGIMLRNNKLRVTIYHYQNAMCIVNVRRRVYSQMFDLMIEQSIFNV